MTVPPTHSRPRLVFFAFGARHANAVHSSRSCAEGNTDAPVLKVSRSAGVVADHTECGRCIGPRCYSDRHQ